MRTYRDFRNNFIAGELAPEFLARSAGEITKTGLKSGLNLFITQAGTLVRRPGSFKLSEVTNTGRMEIFDLLDGSFRYIVLDVGKIDILREDGSLEASLTAPFTADNLYEMTVVNDEDKIIFVHEDYFMRQITYDAATGVWTLAELEWRQDSGSGRIYAPFARFEADGSTMTLSAYAGTAVVTFSKAFLTADYVDVHFLYGFGAQIRITSIISATQANVQIIDRIYPTVNLTVSNGASFKVGDTVETDVTLVRGIVNNRTGNVVSVSLLNGYTLPDVSTNEKLIGPGGSEDVTAVATAATPAAIPVWFEELINPVRGYPSAGAIHRNRLCLAGFPQAPNLMVASATNTLDDFDVGDGDAADAISARIGSDPNVKIRYLSSMEQLFINTDRGTYYVDEGGNRLFTPALINFNYITPDRVAKRPPVITTSGVAFIDDRNRVMLASMTGTNRATWALQDISKVGYHTIKDPKQLFFSTGIAGRPERILGVVNSDGTAACFGYNQSSEQAGWLPWTRGVNSTFVSFASWRGELYCLADINSQGVIERFDFTAVIDCQFSTNLYQGDTAHILQGSHVIGEGVVPATIPADTSYGYGFPVECIPAPMVIGQAGRQRRRASKIYVDVIETGTYRCEDVVATGYPYETVMSDVAPVNDREDEFNQLGSSYNRVITITQKEGEDAPLHIRSITLRMKAR